MIRVRVLLFAVYRDLAGTAEVDVEVPFEATARTAVDRLRALNDRFARLPAEPAVAVNLEYTGLDASLNDGDELALLPPVAGG